MKRRTVSLLCKLGTVLLLFACTRPHEPHRVTRGFYYWRSVFWLSPAESRIIDSLHITTLYTRFFDIGWDPAAGAHPIAPIRFDTPLPPGMALVPVVFITNETLQHTRDAAIDSLAAHLAVLLRSMTSGMSVQEIQIDCDWSVSTRAAYFRLLGRLRQEPAFKGRRLSATIRLHQLKYRSLTGIPPVDRGLLMCYNMGNLHDPAARNSILDPAEMRRYTGSLDTYPLPLDAALPIFAWYVWYRDGRYKGLVQAGDLPSLHEQTINFLADTAVDGLSFRRGDFLRYEGCTPKDIVQAAHIISRQVANGELHGLLYHLDEINLRRYSASELNSFYDALR